MKTKITNPLLHALLPVAAVIIYVLLGYLFKAKGWAIGWLVFLLIPIVESAVSAVKSKNPAAFLYPVFVTAVFLAVGMLFHLWHPTWVLFVTIPAFYAICDYVNKNRQQKAYEKSFENAEQDPNIPTPPPFVPTGETPPYTQYPQYPQNAYYPPKKSNALPIVLSIIFSITAISIAGIIAVFSFLKGSVNGFFNLNSNYKNGYTEISTSAEFKTDDINSIDIEWIDGNVYIEYYDGETVYAEENGGNNPNSMCYKIENGTLKIQEYVEQNWVVFKSFSSKDLTLKIPQTFKADEIEISVVSANVYASELNTKELEFETVSGNGDFEFAVAPNKIDTESVSGDVKVTLPEDVSGYKVSRESVSGSFSARDFDNSERYGDGSVIIKSSSVSGNLTLNKSKAKTVAA